jgi:hypothetical protein
VAAAFALTMALPNFRSSPCAQHARNSTVRITPACKGFTAQGLFHARENGIDHKLRTLHGHHLLVGQLLNQVGFGHADRFRLHGNSGGFLVGRVRRGMEA